LSSQPRFGECFFQFCESFLLPPLGIGRFRCLYEIPETAMPGVLEAKIDHVILRSDEITIQVKLKAVTT